MDTEKLLRILSDIDFDEKQINISSKIIEIKGHLSQNTEEGFNTATQFFKDFEQLLLEKSISVRFTRTENAILESIGGRPYFGSGLISSLSTILSAQSFGIAQRIDQYIKDRKSFLTKIERLKIALQAVNIAEYRSSDYEIAIVLPNDISSAENVSKCIRDFELLISAIQELILGKKGEVKINRLNNGSLEFFTPQTYDVAIGVTTLLANLIVVWDKIAAFNRNIDDTNTQTILSTEAKEGIQEILKGEIEKAKRDLLEEIPEQVIKKAKKDLLPDRKNELGNQVRIKLRAAFKWFELGVEIDVIPVRIGNEIKVPENADATDDQVVSSRTDEVDLLNKTNVALQKFYDIPLDVRKLPFQLPEGDIKDKEQGDSPN